MINRIIDFLKENNLQDKTIIVGFSGGFDSMCLLDILSRIKNANPEFFDMTVIAAHFNHNWRGEESLREQEVCRLFAASKGFEFYTKTANLGLKKTENDARIARYEFFEEAYENYDADAVLTAHNKDDNAETVLYRVIKGTGLIGLKGIAEKRGIFYRPLLKTSRYDILDYCNKNNLNPNFDSSNLNTVYNRNNIRLNILPMLETINPSVKDALNNLAIVATNEDKIIEEFLLTIKSKILNDDGNIISSEFKTLSKPVKLRVIYELIQNLGLDYDYKKVLEIMDFIEKNINQRNGNTLSLTTTLWLYVNDTVIETIPGRKKTKDTDFSITVDAIGEYKISDENKILISKYFQKELFVFPESTAKFVYVDLSKIQFPLVLRHRKDGDIINPFGMSGSMKLKKYLNSKGVVRHKRDELLVLADNNEVLWVVGVGISNKIGVTTSPTHVIEIV